MDGWVDGWMTQISWKTNSFKLFPLLPKSMDSVVLLTAKLKLPNTTLALAPALRTPPWVCIFAVTQLSNISFPVCESLYRPVHCHTWRKKKYLTKEIKMSSQRRFTAGLQRESNPWWTSAAIINSRVQVSACFCLWPNTFVVCFIKKLHWHANPLT